MLKLHPDALVRPAPRLTPYLHRRAQPGRLWWMGLTGCVAPVPLGRKRSLCGFLRPAGSRQRDAGRDHLRLVLRLRRRDAPVDLGLRRRGPAEAGRIIRRHEHPEAGRLKAAWWGE